MNPLAAQRVRFTAAWCRGIGQILLEDVRFDLNSGQLISASFMDYAMPRASDLSFMEVQSNEVVNQGTNSLGIKEARARLSMWALPVRRRQRRRECAQPARYPRLANAGDARAPLASHQGSAGPKVGSFGAAR